MKLSSDSLARLLGAVVGAVVLGFVGRELAVAFDLPALPLVIASGVVGLLLGLAFGPYLTTRPARSIRNWLIRMPSERLGAVIVGLFIGLAASALLSFPLAALPDPLGAIFPIVAAIVFCYFSIVVVVWRREDLRQLFLNVRPAKESGSSPAAPLAESFILLDTSVVIDGRIADISKTGFLRSTLLVPNFILMELQHIADSADTLRRNRGRRGMEVLRILQQEAPVPVKITDMDASGVRDVDAKLISLARELRCPIMTNDYNLNRVAELQGIVVLNINDLANAVKVAFLPGEELLVKIIQEGKEYGQGVGYLEDGTMVVVEDADHRINDTLNVTVTKVLQTTAGRMVFAKP